MGVDGLDSGGRHGRRFVLCHTHRPQTRPYPICTGRSGNVRNRCGGGWAGPRLFLGGSFRVCVYRCLELKCGVLWDCLPIPHSIDDPHVCCCQKNWWAVVRWAQMGVSISGAGQLHLMDGCPGSMARRPRDCVARLRGSSAGWMPARIGRLSTGVGRRHPVTIRKVSLMVGSIRRVWALRHQTGAQYSAVEWTRARVAVRNVVAPAPQPEPASRLRSATRYVSFLRSD